MCGSQQFPQYDDVRSSSCYAEKGDHDVHDSVEVLILASASIPCVARAVEKESTASVAQQSYIASSFSTRRRPQVYDTKMLTKEYRIPFPSTLAEYRVGK